MEVSNFKRYDSFEKDFWYVRSRQDLLKRIIYKYFKNKLKKRKLRILDLGCGTGFNLYMLREFGEVYGIDISEEALKICKKNGFKNVKLGDAHNLDCFGDNFFDLVIAVELFEHLEDDLKALAEVRRVLKKDGLLIGTTPAHKFLWSIDDELAHHKRRYSKRELRSKLSSFFKLEKLRYRYFFFFLPSFIIFNFQKLVYRKKKVKKNSLEYTPKLLNKLMNKIMTLENYLLSKNVYLPFGVGFLFVCRKK